MRETIDFVQSRLDFPLEVHTPWIASRPLSDSDNGSLAASMLGAIQSVTGPKETLGVAYGTNASTIAAAGVPSVVFGPGSIAQAHTADEWLPLDELEASAEILFRFAATFGGS